MMMMSVSVIVIFLGNLMMTLFGRIGQCCKVWWVIKE